MARQQNAVFTSSVRLDRQQSAAIRSPNTCPPNALSETSVVSPEQKPPLRVGVDPHGLLRQPTRSCSLVASLQQLVCGEAGRKKTNCATLIRGRAVVARGALRRVALIGLDGATPRITRAKLPNPARGMHCMSTPHATTSRKGAGHRNIAHVGECALPTASTTSRSSVCQPRQSAAVIHSEHGNQDSNLYRQ